MQINSSRVEGQRPGRIVNENLIDLRLRDALDLEHLGHGRVQQVAVPVAAELFEPVLGVYVVRHQNSLLRSLVAQLPGQGNSEYRLIRQSWKVRFVVSPDEVHSLCVVGVVVVR